MPRKYKRFDDAGLERAYRSHPGKIWTHDEIAEAAGTSRQNVSQLEKRALRKLRDELERRGIYKS